MAIKAREGYEINIVVLTDGSRLFEEQYGTDTTPAPREISELRKRETERTVALMGGNPDKIRYLDYMDGFLSDFTEEASGIIAGIIQELQPEELYIPTEYEFHPDHVATSVIGKMAFKAAGGQRRICQYFLALKPGLGFGDLNEPVTEVDISEFYQLKKQALTMFDCHLKRVLEGQTEPLFKNFDGYLSKTEKFIL